MSKSLIRQQFGAHAAAYVTSTVHAKGASLERLVALVGPKASWRVLDIATGGGHTALAFAPHVAHVAASDLTEEMLREAGKLAHARGLTNVETVKADAEALPFAEASFDLATCRIAPHHFTDVPRFIAETWRVLKPGGTFALVDNISPDAESVPGFDAAEVADAARAYNAFEKLRDPSHNRCLGMSEWTASIAGRGFVVVHKERLPKVMEFEPWGARLGSDAATIEQLRALLTGASPALKAFLKPHEKDGALWFSLDEGLFIARKPA